jgi:hypothetical protein
MDQKMYRPGSIIVTALTLPQTDINRGLYFNEQIVHAVFEKQEDGWWQSKDILFMSARNVEDDNSRDILKEYLNDYRIREQLAKEFNVPPEAVTVALPKEPRGVKKYHGVNWGYWLNDPYLEDPSADPHPDYIPDLDTDPGCAHCFKYVEYTGLKSAFEADAVFGCAPAFRINEEAA